MLLLVVLRFESQLRTIRAELKAMRMDVSGFIDDYRLLNKFDERTKLHWEVEADKELAKGLAKYQAEHPEQK